MQGGRNIYDVHIFVLKTELNKGYLPYKFFEVNPLKCGGPTSISPRCTPYFHWAGIREYGDYCRGKALKCMNDVFTRIGEFQEVEEYEEVR